MNISKIKEDIEDLDSMEIRHWGKEVGVLLTGNDAQTLLDAWDALENLVEAKIMKDFIGETEAYNKLKAQGWDKAFKLFDTKEMAKAHLNALEYKKNELQKRINDIKLFIE